MKKFLSVILILLFLAGCEDDVRTEKIGDAVAEYHDEYIAIRFE